MNWFVDSAAQLQQHFSLTNLLFIIGFGVFFLGKCVHENYTLLKIILSFFLAAGILTLFEMLALYGLNIEAILSNFTQEVNFLAYVLSMFIAITLFALLFHFEKISMYENGTARYYAASAVFLAIVSWVYIDGPSEEVLEFKIKQQSHKKALNRSVMSFFSRPTVRVFATNFPVEYKTLLEKVIEFRRSKGPSVISFDVGQKGRADRNVVEIYVAEFFEKNADFILKADRDILVNFLRVSRQVLATSMDVEDRKQACSRSVSFYSKGPYGLLKYNQSNNDKLQIAVLNMIHSGRQSNATFARTKPLELQGFEAEALKAGFLRTDFLIKGESKQFCTVMIKLIDKALKADGKQGRHIKAWVALRLTLIGL